MFHWFGMKQLVKEFLMFKLLIILLLSSTHLLAITDGIYVVNGKDKAVQARPFTSLFGDRICVGRHSELSVHFHYGIPTDELAISTSGTGSVTADSDNSVACLGTGAGSGVSIAGVVSKHKLTPAPFFESYMYSIVSFDTSSVSGTEQWVGLFDDNNGLALGMKNNQFGILYRRQGTSDVFINKSNFNIDKLDGSGFSKLNMNPGKVNVFRMCTGWLGSTPIIFEVLTPEGSWYPFHVIRQANSLSTTGLRSPILPMCAQVKRTSGDNDVVMKLVAVEAGIIGDRHEGEGRTFALARSNLRVPNGSTKPILSIKNDSSFKSKANLIDIHLTFMELAAESGDARFSVIKNGTLTGANFSPVSSDSVVQKDTSARSLSGGTPLWYSFITKNHGSKDYYLKHNGIKIDLMPGETLTFLGHGVSSNPDCDVSILWEEII